LIRIYAVDAKMKAEEAASAEADLQYTAL